MKRPALVFGILLLLLGAAFWWLMKNDDLSGPGEEGLLVHCAAGLRKPMTEIARQYEEQFGVEVHLQFGGSGALVSQLELAGGDLYLPADQSYIDLAREKGLVEDAFAAACLTAGMVVAEGNPKGLKELADLSRTDLKISLAEKSASVGQFTWMVLEQEELLDEMISNVVVTKPTVNAIVQDVAIGAVDVTLAWDAVAGSSPEVEWIAVPEFSKRVRRASVGVLTSSKNTAGALHLAQYITARDQGRKVFQEQGFEWGLE